MTDYNQLIAVEIHHPGRVEKDRRRIVGTDRGTGIGIALPAGIHFDQGKACGLQVSLKAQAENNNQDETANFNFETPHLTPRIFIINLQGNLVIQLQNNTFRPMMQ